ncbi:MAG: sugar phosphate nucleotidyltransferase [Deltaproteobacteria bacterium]
MKAVILAAGMGTRLRPMTENLPKGLIEVNGKTLLEYSLDNLAFFGVKDIIIVTGYLENAIKQKIGENYKGIKVEYVCNDYFAETGSMYSLSQIKNIINDDILLLESDLLYEKKAIGCLLESELKDAILMSDLLNNGDDVFICINEDNQVVDLGKKIIEGQKNKIKGCLVGISKLSLGFLEKLFQKAEKDYQSGKMNYHYEECILETSLENAPVYALHCSDLVWTEIDNESDLKLAREVVFPRMKNI